MEHRHHCKYPHLQSHSARDLLNHSTAFPIPPFYSTIINYNNTRLTPSQNTILQSLIEKTSTGTDEKSQPPYKYIVNSTVIQHIGSPSEPEKHGRRGMHSAVGAYWNNEKDGTFSYKWEGAEKKGMDIVIAITWVAI
jgi:hypothetical protein